VSKSLQKEKIRLLKTEIKEIYKCLSCKTALGLELLKVSYKLIPISEALIACESQVVYGILNRSLLEISLTLAQGAYADTSSKEEFLNRTGLQRRMDSLIRKIANFYIYQKTKEPELQNSLNNAKYEYHNLIKTKDFSFTKNEEDYLQKIQEWFKLQEQNNEEAFEKAFDILKFPFNPKPPYKIWDECFSSFQVKEPDFLVALLKDPDFSGFYFRYLKKAGDTFTHPTGSAYLECSEYQQEENGEILTVIDLDKDKAFDMSESIYFLSLARDSLLKISEIETSATNN
jgi:hypothetical protein